MKKFLCFIIASIVGVCIVAQTPVPPGPVMGTWTLAGSPYLIEGVNTIEDGTTLTIEAGVEVKWQNDSCPMWVNGQIMAIGTPTAQIIFTSEDPSGSWGSIRFESTPTGNDSSHFHYCTFSNGEVFGDVPDHSGGAIAALNFGKILIDHCLFENNKALDKNTDPNPSGGAIALENSSPIIRNCVFKGNESYAAGAILCYDQSNPSILNNTFIDNTANDAGYWGTGYGGAISCYLNAHPEIINNSFNNNYAGTGGGAIAMVSQCDPTIKFNLISGNTSAWLAGGIEIQDTCSPIISNNTIADNHADEGGGIDIWGNHCEPVISNTILWGNSASNNGNQVNIMTPNSAAKFYYCDIEGGEIGFGGNPPAVYDSCIKSDPLFENPPTSYYLNSGSPCIDRGDPTMYDPDGTRCDIGAFFFDMTGKTEFGLQGSELIMECYPNPTDGKSEIRYQNTEVRNVSLIVYDPNGKQLKVLVNKGQTVGEYQVQFDASTLPDGMYFIHLQAGKESVIRKLLVVH